MLRLSALTQARLALLWERTAPVMLVPAAALALYLALAIFGVFELWGDPWRLILLALALGVSAAWVRHSLTRWRWPSQTDAERRLEEDSGLTDRPFEALHDQPAAGDDALWSAHRDRMRARLDAAQARRPKAAWGRLDPYGLRISAAVMLIAGGVLAGDLLAPRLSDAFAPRYLAGGGQGATIDLWIEPPAYTGQPTLFLRDRRTAEAPEGSELVARIAGLPRAPRIQGGVAQIEALSDGVHLVRIQPESSGAITLRAGMMRETVTLTLVEDTPPRITFAAEPEGDAQGRLMLEYVAEDDYGLETVLLEFAPAPAADSTLPDSGFETYVFSPGELGAPDSEGIRQADLDLSRSKFAGERVVIRLAGLDGAGQRGRSGEMTLTLPQRVFLDPLARAVAAERRRFLQVDAPYGPMPESDTAEILFLDDQPARRIERAPAEIQRLALALSAVSDAPADYFDDAIVWLGLRTALNEVRRARERAELTHMDTDLWEIALRAELGSLADAEAALRAAERALSDALARGADSIELSALFDAFEQAMANYMQLLAREAAEAGRFAEGGGEGGMNSDSLQQLLDALREAAELGDTAGSRRALAQLAEMLRNMQIQLGSGGGDGEGESPMAEALREALEELSDTITDQRELMEDTFNAERDSQAQSGDTRDPLSDPLAPGAPETGTGTQSFETQDQGASGPSLEELADAQQALSETLEDLDERFPNLTSGESGDEATAALDAARDAMEEAANALAQGNGEDALMAQDDALGQLRAASQAGAEALERELAQGEDGEGRDPLGRDGSGEGDATLPTEAERQRARDILEELRRRAAERNRPQEELDYIDRLLERF